LGAVCATMFTPFTYSVHSVHIQPGDLLISEVMANPSVVSDANGEWFEIFNASASAIDLNGLILSDDGVDSHTINAGSLLIASGDYVTLGRNADSVTNGGYTADYVYSNFFLLANAGDEIVISEGIAEIARLNYLGSFVQAGVSMELNSDGTYSAATVAYGSGDFGTPGAAGPSLSAVPLPPAIWLFGSSLLGLIGIARKKKTT